MKDWWVKKILNKCPIYYEKKEICKQMNDKGNLLNDEISKMMLLCRVTLQRSSYIKWSVINVLYNRTCEGFIVRAFYIRYSGVSDIVENWKYLQTSLLLFWSWVYNSSFEQTWLSFKDLKMVKSISQKSDLGKTTTCPWI